MTTEREKRLEKFLNKSGSELLDEIKDELYHQPKSAYVDKILQIRLNENVKEFVKTTKQHSLAMEVFTVALVIIGLFQLLASIADPEGVWALVWFGVISAFVVVLDRMVFKKMLENKMNGDNSREESEK